jgi:hypothetical protein
VNSYDAVTYGVMVLGLVAINVYIYSREHYDAEVKPVAKCPR